jgi:hypothetical protein
MANLAFMIAERGGLDPKGGTTHPAFDRPHQVGTRCTVANVASALFGGLPATGTLARTATNARAGARSPVAGMLHALFLLIFMLVLAPWMSYIPLAALAAVH